MTITDKLRKMIEEEEDKTIRCRNDMYQQEGKLKKVLKSLQIAWMLRELLEFDKLDPLIYFALAQLPIEEIATDNSGDVSESYGKFLEGMLKYSIDEFYDIAVKLKGVEP